MEKLVPVQEIIENVLKQYEVSDYYEMADNLYTFETSSNYYKFSIEIDEEDEEANVSVEILVNEDWQSDEDFTFEI